MRVTPRPLWTGAENLTPTGIQSPDRPGRSQSLHRLRYPAHYTKGTDILKGPERDIPQLPKRTLRSRLPSSLPTCLKGVLRKSQEKLHSVQFSFSYLKP